MVIITVVIGSIAMYGLAYLLSSSLDCQYAVSMTPEECERHFQFGWDVVVPTGTIVAGVFLLIIMPQINESFARTTKEMKRDDQ